MAEDIKHCQRKWLEHAVRISPESLPSAMAGTL